MDEHDKDYGMQDMDNMSRSNVWKDYGSMYENGWTWKVHMDGWKERWKSRSKMEKDDEQ